MKCNEKIPISGHTWTSSYTRGEIAAKSFIDRHISLSNHIAQSKTLGIRYWNLPFSSFYISNNNIIMDRVLFSNFYSSFKRFWFLTDDERDIDETVV